MKTNPQFFSKPFALESPEIYGLDDVNDKGITHDRTNQVSVVQRLGRRHLQGRVELGNVWDGHRYTSHPKGGKDHRDGSSRLNEGNLMGSEELNDEELWGSLSETMHDADTIFIPESENPPRTSLSARAGPVVNLLSGSCSGTLRRVRYSKKK